MEGGPREEIAIFTEGSLIAISTEGDPDWNTIYRGERGTGMQSVWRGNTPKPKGNPPPERDRYFNQEEPHPPEWDRYI